MKMKMKMKIKFRRSTYDNEAKSSSEMVASIDHLLTCILLRLPVKSLIRFKLVSKHWHSLITDPHFCRLRHANPNPAVGLFIHFPNSPIFEYIPFSLTQSPNLNFTNDNDNSRIGIMQSCNGLLLCCTYHPRPFQNRRFYVYNPTTTRFSKLPKLGCDSRNICGISLASDPAKSPHYKVVCVSGVGGPYQIEVYSSERGPWRKCGEPLGHHHNLNFNNGVYWNGAIHWLSNDSGDSLYFDVENEIRRDFASPPIRGGWNSRSGFYLGESRDRLHYVEMRCSEVEMDVYELKRDYSEWFVKYKVDLTCVVASYPEILQDGLSHGDWGCYAYSVFGVFGGRREEDFFLVLHIPGRLLRYNLVYRTFLTLQEFQDSDQTRVVEGSLRYFGTNCSQHIHSLSCV